MSEYQYYDFYSADKPLSSEDKKEINSWSSRASVSRHQAIFTYNYSDIPVDEMQAVLSYFDGLLYYASYGTRRVVLKLPAHLADYNKLKQYDCKASFHYHNYLSVTKKRKYVLIDMFFSEDDVDWIEGEGLLANFMNFRKDILNGDYRVLFIFWLHILKEQYQYKNMDDEKGIPQHLIPANLNKLTPVLNEFIDFFEIDRDWIATAAVSYSETDDDKKVDFAKKVANLDAKTKNDFLLRLLNGETNLVFALKKELSNFSKKQRAIEKYISFDEFYQQIKTIVENRNIKKQRAAVKAHTKKMKKLAATKGDIWKSIDVLLLKSSASNYKHIAEHLVDLKALSIFEDKQDFFIGRVDEIKQKYARRRTFIELLKRHKL
ncbi:MAG: hypothetical protein ACPG5B_05275 [Chitinophagales bacterium]